MKEQSQRRSGVSDTSMTLLRDVADSQHARWAVFLSRYEPMMQAFMRERFPSIDADDVIQETFLALARILPRYAYNPKENGHFHNYLTGILRNKALKALAARTRDAKLKERAASIGSCVPSDSKAEGDYLAWQKSIYEIALQQLLADDTIHERTKQIFVCLAIKGEKPEAVATAFGLPYNTVIKTKTRMLDRLRDSVEALKNA